VEDRPRVGESESAADERAMETAGPWIELEVKRHRRRVFRDPNLGVVDATPSTHPALSRGARPCGVDGATPSTSEPCGCPLVVGGLIEAALITGGRRSGGCLATSALTSYSSLYQAESSQEFIYASPEGLRFTI